MQFQETLDQQENLINDNQGQTSKEKPQRLNDPVVKKDLNAYENFIQNYNSLSMQNKQLKLENRNLAQENESLRKQLNCFNNLQFELEQKEKQIEHFQIQTVQNQNLWLANARHIKEICRLIQLLEYKQEHIKSLQQQLKEEKNKLIIKEQELPIPDDLENKSHLNNDDKYFVEEEYKKQKEYFEFRKRYKQYQGKIELK